MKKNLKQLGIGLVCSFAALATTAVAQTTDSQSQFGDLVAQQAGPQRGGQNQRGFGGPQGGQRGMMRGMQRDVLRIKEVQEHLKLSKEQIDKIMTWRPEGAPEGPPQGGRGGFGGGQGQGQGRGGFGGGQQGGQAGPPQGRGGFGQNQEQMEKMRKEREKFILSVIGQQKFDRYQELQLQFDGISAVNRPDIAKELGLTAAQKNKIQEIMEKYRPNRGGQGGPPEGGRGGFGGGQQGGQAGPPQGGMNPNQMKAMREKMEKEIRTVLTAAQQNKWDAMLGAKFTFPENAFRQGPPPGGQGGPPQGGRGGFGGGQGGRTGGGGGGEIL